MSNTILFAQCAFVTASLAACAPPSSLDASGEADDIGRSRAFAQATASECYLVADADDELSLVDKASGDEVTVGSLGAMNVEAIAYDPVANTLYGTNAGRLGVIDLNSGGFAPRLLPVGGGLGSAGFVMFDDVDGLTFDPFTDTLYGSVRRDAAPDLLIKINIGTGAAVNNAFGVNATYVVIEPAALGFGDCEDIAIDPTTGQMYAIQIDDMGESRLVSVDKATGVTTEIGSVGFDDVEGLAFDVEGTLLGTVGDIDMSGELIDISKSTGAGSNARLLDNSGDYEAVDCMTVPRHDLEVDMTVDNLQPSMNTSITYTITLTNNGPHNAAGVSLMVQLGTGVVYASHTASAGMYVVATGVWTVDDLDRGTSATLEITATVTAMPGMMVTSTADGLTSSGFDPITGNDSASVTVTVPQSDDPMAVDDTKITDEDTAVRINVLENDTSPASSTLMISTVEDPPNGTAMITGSTITYTPNANFNGDDAFTYTVSDGNDRTATAAVIVTVTPVNDDPLAVPDVATTDENTAVVVNVLANDTDVDGDTLAVTEVEPAPNGVAVVTGEAVTYTPNEGFTGTDSFTYTIADGNGGTATANVTVTVARERDANGDGFDDDLGTAGGGCTAGGQQDGGAVWLLLALGALLVRRRRPGRSRTAAITAALAALAALAPTPSARAQAAFETDYAVERFRLATGRRGVLDAESGDAIPHLSFDVGMWLGYANDPLTLYRRDEMTNGRERAGELVARRIGGNLVGALGLWNRLQLGFDVPLVLSQTTDIGDAMGPPSSIASFGLGDLRVVTKLQLLTTENVGVDVALLAGITVPTGSTGEYIGDGAITYAPELALSRPVTAAMRVALDVGYRVRPPQTTLDLVVDDEIFAHLGAGYLMTDRFELDVTLALATGADDAFGAFNRNYGELKGGAAYHMGGAMTFASVGVGVAEGFGTPDWRLVMGARFGGGGSGEARREAVAPIVVDLDGDGLLDADDRCPRAAETRNGHEDGDGCPDAIPDTDGDGLDDRADQCPDGAENANGWQDDDGCPDELPDTDGDGIDDGVDKCPNEPEDLDGFEDGDGCRDSDNDGDGVVDRIDECVNEAGPVENVGCPDNDRDGDTLIDRLDNCPDEPGPVARRGCKAVQMVVITQNQLQILDQVFFRTNRATILRRSFPLLDNVARVLAAHPEIRRVRIEGHTDDRGDDARNKALSQRRADAVAAYLVRKGVAAERLEAVGFGEERPVADNDTRAGRAANRRVEFNLSGDTAGVEQQDTGPTDDTLAP